MIKRVHVHITGVVQGVFYRVSTKQKADELGIRGWVKNTHDGAVEAVFEGEEAVVQEMIDWCFQGPPRSKVIDVKVRPLSLDGGLKGFSVHYR